MSVTAPVLFFILFNQVNQLSASSYFQQQPGLYYNSVVAPEQV